VIAVGLGFAGYGYTHHRRPRLPRS
jgi:hypothetical protein